MTIAPRQRMIVMGGMRPVLPRHVRLRFDKTRQIWFLLAPERVLTPDDVAVEVLQLCDGERTLDTIAAALACKYAAPQEQIAADVAAMLQDLADKGFLSEMYEEPE